MAKRQWDSEPESQEACGKHEFPHCEGCAESCDTESPVCGRCADKFFEKCRHCKDRSTCEKCVFKCEYCEGCGGCDGDPDCEDYKNGACDGGCEGCGGCDECDMREAMEAISDVLAAEDADTDAEDTAEDELGQALDQYMDESEPPAGSSRPADVITIPLDVLEDGSLSPLPAVTLMAERGRRPLTEKEQLLATKILPLFNSLAMAAKAGHLEGLDPSLVDVLKQMELMEGDVLNLQAMRMEDEGLITLLTRNGETITQEE